MILAILGILMNAYVVQKLIRFAIADYVRLKFTKNFYANISGKIQEWMRVSSSSNVHIRFTFLVIDHFCCFAEYRGF